MSARGARCTELGGPGLGCGPAECLAGAKGTKWRRGTPFHPLPSPGSGSGEGQGTLLGEGSRGYSGGPWDPLRRPGGGGGQALGLPCGLISGCERQGTARTPRAERWTGGAALLLRGAARSEVSGISKLRRASGGAALPAFHLTGDRHHLILSEVYHAFPAQ